MICENLRHFRFIMQRFSRYPDGSVDTETISSTEDKGDALVHGRARIKIWSICHRGESYSFPTNMYDPKYPTMDEYIQYLKPYALNPAIEKVFHNANYDLNVFFTSTNAKIWKKFWDTMIGAWMANVALEKGLKSRAPLYGRSLGSLYLSKKMEKEGFSAVSMELLEQVAKYAEEDVITTDELFQMQKFGFVERRKKIPHIDAKGRIVWVKNHMPTGKLVIEGESLTKFKRDWIDMQEIPYLRATMRAERRGFPLNMPRLLIKREQCRSDREKIMRDLYQAAGEKINLNAPQQIVKKIFEPHNIECPFRTKTGKVQLDAAALFKMRNLHPLVAKLEKYRKLEKLQSVYLGDPLHHKKPSWGLEHYVAKDGRIRCTMNTIGAVTGRTSAQEPNLTQIPSRQDIYGIKDLFEPPKGKVLICLDYAQLEIRIMAILCKDPLMLKILNDPKGDIHQNTADRFSVDRSPTAKQLNFLMLYGGGAYMLSEKLTVEGVPTSKTEAGAYIDTYNDVYYRVHQYREELLEEHKTKGYVRLLTGRRRHLTDLDWNDNFSVHKAETTLSNNVVQGSGQDMLKASIIRCDPFCPNIDAELPKRMSLPISHRLLLQHYARKVEKVRKLLTLAKAEWILQVHDEVIYFADKHAAEEVSNTLADVMTWRHFFPATTDYTVPLVAEGGVGYNWRQAKNDKEKNGPVQLFHVSAGFDKH